MKQLQGTIIKSVATVATYEKALTRVAEVQKQHRLGDGAGLPNFTRKAAITYLEIRSHKVGQKLLDQERQAIQAMFSHVSHRMAPGERLPVVKSDHKQVLESRAYTREQVPMIAGAQREHNALATRIAYASGLRAHELLTLRPRSERPPDPRPASQYKFSGREGERYTVVGKGGLIREVLIPRDLAAQLEARRLDAPVRLTDRGIHYQQRYKIGGGINWSKSFSQASSRELGWSTGAHGVRHSYAQERMGELRLSGLSRTESLLVVSQELGHFRPNITEVYLR